MNNCRSGERKRTLALKRLMVGYGRMKITCTHIAHTHKCTHTLTHSLTQTLTISHTRNHSCKHIHLNTPSITYTHFFASAGMRTWDLHVSAYDLFRGQCLRALLLSLYHKLHTQAPVLIENITLDTITSQKLLLNLKSINYAINRIIINAASDFSRSQIS